MLLRSFALTLPALLIAGFSGPAYAQSPAPSSTSALSSRAATALLDAPVTGSITGETENGTGSFFGVGHVSCSSWNNTTPAPQAQQYENWVVGAFSGLQTACLLVNQNNATSCGGNALKPTDEKLIRDSVRLTCSLSPKLSLGEATLTVWRKYARVGTVVNTMDQVQGLFSDLAQKVEGLVEGTSSSPPNDPAK